MYVSQIKYVVFNPECGRVGNTQKSWTHSRVKGGCPQLLLGGGEGDDINTILSVFMFIRTGSVFDSMYTYRKQY